MIGEKKSFGSLYDQSESADLDDLQFERTHTKSYFCVDTAGICCISIFFCFYIVLVLAYSLITLRTPDKISRSISRVPIFTSKKNSSIASFKIDLKISDLHHNPTLYNILNCSAVKYLSESYFQMESYQELSNANLNAYVKYQNIALQDYFEVKNQKDDKEIYVQFNITEMHRILYRNSTFGDYSSSIFKNITAIFPKKSMYSTEFNIFSFIFNDPDYFSVEKNPNNYIYSEHSELNSPSLISTLMIQTNFSQFNALDFVYYYINPITKKYFSELLQIFVSFVLFALSINLFYSKHKIEKFTRISCIILGILGILAINPFENYINTKVFDHLTPNHTLSLNTNNYQNQNELSLCFGCFSFALFINALRLFICLQFCFICSHNFVSMFRVPNLFVTFGLFAFYFVFTLIDYNAQYYHEKNVLRYSSLSYANRDTLISEQESRLQHVSYDTSLFLPSAMASQNGLIPPFRIEKVRMYFVLAHFCFYIWLIKTSLEKINDGADPNPIAESDRLKALILFTIVPNIAAILAHCLFVSYSVLQRKILPEVLLFVSNELSVASILILFRGVEIDDDIEDDSYQRFYKLGKNSDFDQRSFEIN